MEINIIEFIRVEDACGFVKSRKSEGKIMNICENMLEFGAKRFLNITDIIVDGSCGRDVDRSQIDCLMEGLEVGRYRIIVVSSINDISKDHDDIATFLRKASYLGGTVVSMETGQSIKCGYDEEC